MTLVGGFNPSENMSQNGNLPQLGVKIKNTWNHHLVLYVTRYDWVWLRGFLTCKKLGLQTTCRLATFYADGFTLEACDFGSSPAIL